MYYLTLLRRGKKKKNTLKFLMNNILAMLTDSWKNSPVVLMRIFKFKKISLVCDDLFNPNS